MNKLHKTVLIGFILAILAAGNGCSQLGGGQSICDGNYPVRSAAAGSYQYGSKTEKFSYTVQADRSATRLHLVFEHQEGSVSWAFSDPSGEVRWNGELTQAGPFDEIRDFQPVQGEWRLEINGLDGSGKYEHCWMAK